MMTSSLAHCIAKRILTKDFCDSICMSVMYIYLMTFDVGVSVDVNIYMRTTHVYVHAYICSACV